jgi:alpha-1,6-mannosyltransferase
MLPDPRGVVHEPLPSGRLKVCDLALFSPSSSSGVKTYIASKIAYVRERIDIEHVVIVPGPSDHLSTDGRSRVIVVRGVPSPYPGVWLGLNLVKIARLIDREAPDIIELNCQYTLGWAAFLATWRRRTPIVGVYHTDVPACARHWALPAGKMVASVVERLVEFYEGLIYRHCTLTILLNARMADRIARLGVHRTRCLPCGVDPAMFTPARRDPDLRRRLGITPAQKIVFYAGRLSPEKELDTLFAAFEQLPHPDFVLMIAGDGPDAPAVARYAAAHPHVHYLGHLDSRAGLATAYASSDVFVIPGRYETFGMSTLEAIASGLPVAGIESSGTASVVPPRAGVMAKPGDATDLAAAIGIVTAWDPETTREECHRFAATRFAWDQVFDRYFETYRELITGAPFAAEEVPA